MYLIEMYDGNKYKIVNQNRGRCNADILYRDFSTWQVLTSHFIFETFQSHIYKSRFFHNDFMALGKTLCSFENAPVMTTEAFNEIYNKKAHVVNTEPLY